MLDYPATKLGFSGGALGFVSGGNSKRVHISRILTALR